MDVSELFQESLQIWVVKNWEDYKAQTYQLIELGHLGPLRELTNFFINSAGWEREIRRNALEDIYKDNFVNKSIDEQKEAVELAQRIEKEMIDKAIAEIPSQVDENINIVPELRSATNPHTRARRPTRRKTKEERMQGKYKTNTLSPATFNYLRTEKGASVKFEKKEQSDDGEIILNEVQGLSDNCEILLDFLFDRLAKSDNGKLLKESAKENYRIRFDQFQNAIDGFVTNIEVTSRIGFTGKEFRRHFKGLRITDNDLVNALAELQNTKIIISSAKIWYDAENRCYHKTNLSSHIIDTLQIRESGQIAPRTKSPLFEFTIKFGTGWAMILHNDAINRRFGCFSVEFYKIDKRTRRLGRYLKCFKFPVLTIKKASEILEYEQRISNLSVRKGHIEHHLDELKRLGIIKSWKRHKTNGKESKGLQTAWDIQTI